MEDYNWVMFTHATDFSKEHVKFKEVDSITFFHKLTL